jgi:hypothetical protein
MSDSKSVIKIRKNNRANMPEVLALRIFPNLFLKRPVLEMEPRASSCEIKCVSNNAASKRVGLKLPEIRYYVN